MKRHLLTVALFLLLGAVLNVAVAWACVLWIPLDGSRMLREFEVQERLPPHVEVSPEYFFFHGFEVASPGRQILSLAGTEIDSRGLEAAVPLYIELHAGWPCFGLRGTATMTEFGLSEPSLAFLPDDLMDRVEWPMLPLRPRWAGSVFNMASYATVLWLLIRGPFVLRRYMRVRRHLCPTCGYPVGVSAVCTECGQPVSPST